MVDANVMFGQKVICMQTNSSCSMLCTPTTRCDGRISNLNLKVSPTECIWSLIFHGTGCTRQPSRYEATLDEATLVTTRVFYF